MTWGVCHSFPVKTEYTDGIEFEGTVAQRGVSTDPAKDVDRHHIRRTG